MESQLTEEEKMVRDSFRAYCDDKLMSRIIMANRNESRLWNSGSSKICWSMKQITFEMIENKYLSFAINTNSISLWNSVPKICETIVLCGSIVLINYFTFKYIIERKPLINKTHLMVATVNAIVISCHCRIWPRNSVRNGIHRSARAHHQRIWMCRCLFGSLWPDS